MKAAADFDARAERGEKAWLLIVSSIPPSSVPNLPCPSSEHPSLEKAAQLKKKETINPPPRTRKKSKTTNRKQTTKAGSIIHNGKGYRVNNGNGKKKCALYTPILHRIIDQYQIALEKWRRVFVLRVELHLPHETDNNRIVSLFLKRLNKQLKQKYGFKDIGYAWAREYHGRGKGQHYHLALFLDGNKVRHSSRINETIKSSWERPLGGYHIGYIKRPFYFVNNQDIEQQAIYRVSYLAKTRGKGERPPQTKDYQCSRMKR